MPDYNTKILVYPNGHNKVTYASENIFHVRDWDDLPGEETDYCFEPSHTFSGFKRKRCTADEADTRDDSVWRSKQKVFDLAYCNDWDYFFTGTFDPCKLDYNDPQLVRRKISRFMSNMVQRRGLAYLLVPEYFSKGTGIHFHALCKGTDVFDLSFDGHYHKFKNGVRVKVYNVDNWKYGWSTCIPCSGDKIRLCCYVTKYIAKNTNRIFGKYYLSSNNLRRSPEIAYGNTNFDNVDKDAFPSWRDNLLLKYDNNITFDQI